MESKRASACLLLLLLAPAPQAAARRAGTQSFAVDPGRSRVSIVVGKSGIFSFAAGHTHEVVAPAISGIVELSAEEPAGSRVRIDIDASALRVTGKGEPAADVPKVQRTMLSEQVLDVGRYPRIAFESTALSVKSRQGAIIDLIVTGTLTLHNVTRSIGVPVRAELTPHALTASGRFSLKQSDYGITPLSVGGVVAVKDALEITFAIVARERDRD